MCDNLCQTCKFMADYDSTYEYDENKVCTLFEVNYVYCTEYHGKHGIRFKCPKYQKLRKIE